MTVSQETAQNVLRKHFARLAQAISDPLVVATELFGKGIIGLTLLGRIRDVPAPNHDKSTLLLEAVYNQIADDTSRFETFLAILRKDAPLRPLVESMETMWGKPLVQHEDQPHDGNVTGQPHDGNATGHPHDGNATGQPHDGNMTGQPHDRNTTGQPHDGNATGQLRGGNATGQPRDGNATCQPRGENAAGQQHGENRENVEKVTNSATPTPDQILAVRVVKETTKTIKERFTHLLTTACGKLKEKHDIEMFRLFLVSMCEEDKPCCKETLMTILAGHSSFVDIFTALTVNGFWSFWPNYGLLESVIKEYTPELVRAMDAYTKDLSAFLLTTKMADYISSIDPREKVPRNHDLEALSMKIDKVKVTEHSLNYIDDLWSSLVEKFSLPKWALLLHKVEEGCVSITWLVPSCAVHHLDGYMQTPECASYFESMNIIEVTLGNKKYYPHVSGHRLQPLSPTVGSPRKPGPSSQDPALEPIATKVIDHQEHEVKSKPQKPRTIKLTWRKGSDAPSKMYAGTTIVDGAVTYFSSKGSKTVYKHDSSIEKWSKLPENPHRHFGLAIVNGLLTAVGGGIHFGSTTASTHTNVANSASAMSGRAGPVISSIVASAIQSVVRLALPPDNQYRWQSTNTLFSLMGKDGERKWREHFPPMPSRRSSPAVVCSGKSLVVAGGKSSRSHSEDPQYGVATVEVMNTDTLQWFTACELPHPLSSPSATVIGNSLYLFGDDRMFTCSLSALQPSWWILRVLLLPSVWQKAAEVPVHNSTYVTLNGQILALGGHDPGYKPTTAVHMYDPTTDSWSVISHMSTPRSECLAAVLPGDELMVVGGHDDHIPLTDSVEIARAKFIHV